MGDTIASLTVLPSDIILEIVSKIDPLVVSLLDPTFGSLNEPFSWPKIVSIRAQLALN